MLKIKLPAIALGATFALPAQAGETVTPHTFASNVSLVSYYLYRGMSQTGIRAAIQGGFD